MGISTDALKHYEKCGVIEFRHDEENGYRYCDFRQCLKLFSVYGTQTANYSLRDSSSYLNEHYTVGDLESALKNVRENFEKEHVLHAHSIAYAEDCLRILEGQLPSSGIHNWRLQEADVSRAFFPFAVNEAFLNKTPQQTEQFNQWIRSAPAVKICAQVQADDPNKDIVYGLAATGDFVRDYYLPREFATTFSGAFLVGDIVTISDDSWDEQRIMNEIARPTLDYIAATGRTCGAVFAEHMFVAECDQGTIRYDRALFQLES